MMPLPTHMPAKLTYLIIGVVAIYMWYPLVFATWGPIDDHEIIKFIGSAERLPFSNLLRVLEGTEVALDSSCLRFRPSYYFLRALESATWGKNPSLWYGARLLLAVSLALSVNALCLRLSFAGTGVSLLFALAIVSGPYWVDIFARLGPGETYAVLGLMLITFGSWPVLSSASRIVSSGSALFISAGVVLAAGSKEVFVLFSLVPLYLIANRRLFISLASRLILGLAVLYCAWIVAEVVERLYITGSGRDIYGQDVSVTFRTTLLLDLISPATFWRSILALRDFVVSGDLSGLKQFLINNVLMFWILWSWLLSISGVFAILVMCSRVAAGNRVKEPDRMRARSYAVIGLMLLFIFVSQYLFYAGAWPRTAGRYLFPGVILGQFAMLFLLNAIWFQQPSVRWLGSMRIATTLACALTFVFITVSANGDRIPIYFSHENSKETARKSNGFVLQLETIAKDLKEDSNVPVIIISHGLGDYEFIFSIATFLRSFDVKNDFSLLMDGYTDHSYAPGSLSRNLASSLENIQLHGNSLFSAFMPNTLPNCFSIAINGPFFEGCSKGLVFRR
jgi:hypothetical protein